MNDNLAEMVNDMTEENEKVELPGEEKGEDKMTETEVKPTDDTNETENPVDEISSDDLKIKITTLGSWFIENKDLLVNPDSEIVEVNYVKPQIKHVDPDEDLIVTVPHPEGLTYKDEPARKIRHIDYAQRVPVLDLPGILMNVFNNNIFRIIYKTPIDDVVIKYYGAASRQVLFCKTVDNMILPYSIQKLKKKDEDLEFIEYDGDLDEKLNSPVPMEDLILRYKQIEKFQAGLDTIRDTMNFFTARCQGIIDINHLIEIDKAMISLIA